MPSTEAKSAKVSYEAWGWLSGPIAATLANRLVQAKVLLHEGGDLVELEDCVGGSPRGIMPAGSRVSLQSGRLPRTGPPASIEHRLIESDDEDDPAIVVLHQMLPGEPCSFQAAYAVHPDSPCVSVEVAVQNRSLEPRFIPSGLRLRLAGAEAWGSLAEGVVVFSLPNGDALVLQSPPHTFDSLTQEGVEWVVSRHAEPLAPLGKDDWTCSLWPLADVGRVWAAGGSVAVGIKPENVLTVRASKPLPSAKMVLLLEGGEAVESVASLSPSQPFAADLALQGLHPVEVAVLDSSKRELARGGPQHPAPDFAAPQARTMPDGLDEYLAGLNGFLRGEEPVELWRAARKAFYAPASLALLAMDALRNGDAQGAQERIEAALQRAGYHPLYWWAKAAIARASGAEDDGSTPYAHSLSPLEPLLRVEGFLNQQDLATENSSLLKPLAECPDAAHDAVAMLFTLGLQHDAARVADELLRHQPLPLVRMMLAWGLLKVAGFEAEVARHISVIESLPVGSPHPCRPYERESILGLASWAPRSQRLQEWASLAAFDAGG